MSRTLTWAPALVGGMAAAMLAFACSSDSTPAPTSDASAGGSDSGAGGGGTGGKSSGGTAGTGGTKTDGGGTGGGGTGGVTTDGGNDGGGSTMALCAGKTGKAQVDCGQYIVQHIDACADCHSPRLANGAPDLTKILAGNPSFADIVPGDDTKGNVPAPNLTALTSQGWTKAEIKDAILNGKRPAHAGGGGLFPAMPYATFHNMASEDADAIVAYISQLSPITNAIPARQPLGALDALLPAPTFDATKIPDSTLKPADAHYAEAQLGKYIASELGVCMECHTERTPQGALDATKLFAGGEVFKIGGPFGDVTSLNITPDVSGIQGWTAADVQTLILTGKDNMGVPICPPMPAGPNGAFGGMKPEQALAIGYYLTTIPPVSNHPADAGAFKMCVPPAPPADASVPDATAPTDAATKG
jgi:hypothetical protein